MKRRLFSWGICIALLIFTVVVLCGLSGSLWFLRALLGDSSGQYTVGYYNSFLNSSSLAKSIQSEKTPFLPSFTDRYNRFVYKRDEQGEYIVGIPKLLNQVSMGEELQQQGWEVRRVGWIVVASKVKGPTLPQPGVMHAIGTVLRGVTLERLPLRPLVVFQLGANEEDAFSFYLEEKHRGLHMVINTDSTRFLRGKNQRLAKEMLSSEMTYVALQRDLLSYIPNEFVIALERRVSESMLLTKTHPLILQSLLPLGPVSLAIEGKNVAVGVLSGRSEPAMLIHEWVNQEQGTRHPIKRAFSLPDKTLGYEYAPGKSNAYFNLNKGKNSCMPSEGYDESLFLCGKDQTVVLSNQENIGNQLTLFFQDKLMMQRGMLQGSVMEAMGLSNQFERIEYIILDDTIEAWADATLN